jgi:hypothetical protein
MDRTDAAQQIAESAPKVRGYVLETGEDAFYRCLSHAPDEEADAWVRVLTVPDGALRCEVCGAAL